MNKIPRISTTITARYTPATGSTDAYWLDGRVPGIRETRAVDVTLDREDKSFLFAVFAPPSIYKESTANFEAVKPVFDKMQMNAKYSGKNIDSLIVDFAECSTDVVGKKTINGDGGKNPYFAGILVRDAEIAAVTSGRGCAYLYRHDTLYPLTHDDLEFDNIDYSGKKVFNIDVYCGGSVGSVRYSNIAQLQVDDCIIVCNKEIMQALGQKEVLRILHDAFDQSDAAGTIITEAAAKLPGTALQFMIGFIENISEAGRGQAKPVPVFPVSRPQPKAHQTATAKSEEKFYDDTDENYGDEEESEVSNNDVADDSDEYDDDYDESDDEGFENSPAVKKIAITTVILVVSLVCAFALWWTLFRNKPPIDNGSSSLSASISDQASISEDPLSGTSGVSQVSTANSSVSTVPTPTVAGDLLGVYTVKAGDWMSKIAEEYYGTSTAKYLDAIVNANKAKYPDIASDYIMPGWILDIPKVD